MTQNGSWFPNDAGHAMKEKRGPVPDKGKASLSTTDIDTLRRLARASERLDDWQEAERWWTHCVAMFPHDAAAWIALAKAQFKRLDADGAVESLHAALRIASDDPAAHLALAIVHAWAQRPAMARDHAERALSGAPDMHDARLARARACLDLEDLDAAEEELRVLDASGHARGEAGILEARLHHARGDTELALAVLSDVIDAYPESLSALAEFREIFGEFSAPEFRQRLREFCDGVGVALPSVQAGSQPDTEETGQIDIVLPVHDNLVDLELCLASVLACSGPRLGRVIIVDDGSNRSWPAP